MSSNLILDIMILHKNFISFKIFSFSSKNKLPKLNSKCLASHKNITLTKLPQVIFGVNLSSTLQYFLQFININNIKNYHSLRFYNILLNLRFYILVRCTVLAKFSLIQNSQQNKKYFQLTPWFGYRYFNNFWGKSTKIYKYLVNFLLTIFYFFLIKVRYKGKSYKWFRTKRSIVLKFGHSHLVYFSKLSYFYSKKLSRMKLLFFGVNEFFFKKYFSSIIWWKPLNVYHNRGLRFAKQRVFRKFGKVSTYR